MAAGRVPPMPARTCPAGTGVRGMDGRVYWPVVNRAGVWSWRAYSRPKAAWRLHPQAGRVVVVAPL